MKRFAGADFAMTPELVEGAQHDRHKFYVEDIVGWRESDDGSIELEVKWRGFHPTWEPIDRLYEDVRNQVVKFLRVNNQHEPLRLALQRLTATAQKTPASRADEDVGAVEAVEEEAEAVVEQEAEAEVVEGEAEAAPGEPRACRQRICLCVFLCVRVHVCVFILFALCRCVFVCVFACACVCVFVHVCVCLYFA